MRCIRGPYTQPLSTGSWTGKDQTTETTGSRGREGEKERAEGEERGREVEKERTERERERKRTEREEREGGREGGQREGGRERKRAAV